MQVKADDKRPFLDFLGEKLEDLQISTRVCRKHTHMEQFLHHELDHSQNIKLGITKHLYDRVRSMSWDVRDREHEFGNISHTKRMWAWIRANREILSSNKEKTCTVVTPYVKGLPEKQRIIRNSIK